MLELKVSSTRTDITIGFLVVGEILQSKSLLPLGPIPSLGFVSRVPAAEKSIRYLGINPFLFALADIGPTMVIGVGRQDRSRKAVLTTADRLQVLLRPVKYRRHMLIILTVSKSLPMNDDLVLGVRHGLATVALDDTMGRVHLGRFVIGYVTRDLLASWPNLGLIVPEPLLNASGLSTPEHFVSFSAE